MVISEKLRLAILASQSQILTESMDAENVCRYLPFLIKKY
jgi:hypothetical protein